MLVIQQGLAVIFLSFVRQGQTLLLGEWLNSSLSGEEVCQVQPLSAAKDKSLFKKSSDLSY